MKTQSQNLLASLSYSDIKNLTAEVKGNCLPQLQKRHAKKFYGCRIMGYSTPQKKHEQQKILCVGHCHSMYSPIKMIVSILNGHCIETEHNYQKTVSYTLEKQSLTLWHGFVY